MNVVLCTSLNRYFTLCETLRPLRNLGGLCGSKNP